MLRRRSGRRGRAEGSGSSLGACPAVWEVARGRGNGVDPRAFCAGSWRDRPPSLLVESVVGRDESLAGAGAEGLGGERRDEGDGNDARSAACVTVSWHPRGRPDRHGRSVSGFARLEHVIVSTGTEKCASRPVHAEIRGSSDLSVHGEPKTRSKEKPVWVRASGARLSSLEP